MYVDDLIITRDTTIANENVIKLICAEFRCRDLGLWRSFLGIEVTRQSDGSIIYANTRKVCNGFIGEFQCHYTNLVGLLHILDQN